MSPPADAHRSGPLEATPTAGREPGALAREGARKLVHLTTATAAALLAWVLPTRQRQILFVAVAACALLLDLARLLRPGLRRHFERAFAPMLRGAEHRRISGATTLALGFMAAVVLFPRAAAVAGLLFAGLGDAASALVGRSHGRHRFPWGKSLEGSLAFLAVAFVIAWGVPGLAPAAALVVALALALLEAAPLPFDDNLLLPVVGAALTFLVANLR